MATEILSEKMPWSDPEPWDSVDVVRNLEVEETVAGALWKDGLRDVLQQQLLPLSI